jgi:uncharacterized protein
MDTTKWLKDRTVYLTLGGSQAYGLATPESDWDYRGLCVMPPDYYFGLYDFEQADSKGTTSLVADLTTPKFPVDDAETTIWNLKKGISLAADGNPNMIELLFMKEEAIAHQHPCMRRFFDIRESFLSQVLKHRFSGYAMQQLKRIRGHKRWLDSPPTEPTREQFGLEGITMPKDQLHACDKLIEFEVDSWLVDQTDLPEDIKIQLYPQVIKVVNVVLEQIGEETRIDRIKEVLERAANRHLGFDADFINFLARYKSYRAALADYKSYQTWLKQRNPARAELERKHGYDTKHALHLVRLFRMCREVLEKHEINVDRRGIDADELMDIRYHGTWKYEDLISWAEKEDTALTELMSKSGLPKGPNRKLINNVLTEVTFEYLKVT